MSSAIDVLPDVKCPVCNETLRLRLIAPGDRAAEETWTQWRRRCEVHGIAFSNARRDPVMIYRAHEQNVPVQVRARLSDTLDRALNETNLTNKRSKFGYETSEDAVTWTVFSYLVGEGRLGAALGALLPNLWPRDLPVTLLLWGSPMPDSTTGHELRERLVKISTDLGEEPRQRSEPDVLVVASDGTVAIIEVKYRSANDEKVETYKGWDRGYTASPAFSDPTRAGRSGHYELARYWRIAWALANGRPFALVNLGLPKLFSGEEGKRLDEFEASLAATDKNRFTRDRWSDFLDRLEELPPWLSEWLDRRPTPLRGRHTSSSQV